MIKHFGIDLRNSKYGFKLNKENYAIINNKSSFISGRCYSYEWCNKHLEKCIINYDLNMEYFSKLNKLEFNIQLYKFVQTKGFIEVSDLNEYENVSGYYIMVLDDYCQIYIGTSENIKKRIIDHWNKIKEFDRLIYGNVNNSIISIDSFRALDTTRIFVCPTYQVYELEKNFISCFPSKFLLNRTIGGELDNGLIDINENIRIRNFHHETKKKNNFNKKCIIEEEPQKKVYLLKVKKLFKYKFSYKKYNNFYIFFKIFFKKNIHFVNK